MTGLKISIANTEQTEYTWAHIEVGSGVDFSNCGCFNFRNLDFSLFLAVVIVGCRKLEVPLIVEDFNDKNTNSI